MRLTTVVAAVLRHAPLENSECGASARRVSLATVKTVPISTNAFRQKLPTADAARTLSAVTRSVPESAPAKKVSSQIRWMRTNASRVMTYTEDIKEKNVIRWPSADSPSLGINRLNAAVHPRRRHGCPG